MRWISWLKQLLLACSVLLLAHGSAFAQNQFVRKFELELTPGDRTQSRQLERFVFSAFVIIPEGPTPNTLIATINGQKVELALDEHGPRPAYFLSMPDEIEDLVINYEGSVELYAINSGLPPEVRSRPGELQTDCLTQPPMVTQEDWRSGLPAPSFNRLPNTVTHHIVHHAAGSNTNTNYTQVVRDIYVFHTEVNGWSDIGYNFLVAQDGTIYEGRDPGPALTEFGVVGAHFCGKNTGTLGICMLGNYETAEPSEAALTHLQALLSFSFDQLDIDPLGLSNHRGDALDHLSGHRDGCSTLCPGANLYSRLPGLRAAIQTDLDDCGDPQPPPEPQRELTFEGPTTGNTRMPIQFVNTSQGYENYQWFFEGGTPASDTATAVEVTYRLVGPYDVTLIGFSEDGVPDTLRADNYINIRSNQAIPLVYPNPVQAVEPLYIDLQDPIVLIEIFSISGKEVAFFTGVDGRLEVPPLRRGVYILKISTQQQVFFQKLKVQ